MIKGLSGFISETAEREHREYLASLKCRASILKKDGIDIYADRLAFANARPRLTDRERQELFRLADEIRMHELYFSSFGASYVPSEAVRASFGSENNFAYELSELAGRTDSGFICIYTDRSGRVGFSEQSAVPRTATPRLALDLAEHAYFRDYGFRRDKYIRAALAHLDFEKLNTV